MAANGLPRNMTGQLPDGYQPVPIFPSVFVDKTLTSQCGRRVCAGANPREVHTQKGTSTLWTLTFGVTDRFALTDVLDAGRAISSRDSTRFNCSTSWPTRRSTESFCDPTICSWTSQCHRCAEDEGTRGRLGKVIPKLVDEEHRDRESLRRLGDRSRLPCWIDCIPCLDPVCSASRRAVSHQCKERLDRGV
jgi:hypothetical protein